mmetsp:Transcript_142404/g.454347  ORF Transcript_142404/g.454347 Transcript_142404/m.454347 type:complete len:412 (-) Transcript_142404:51-1286(-)
MPGLRIPAHNVSSVSAGSTDDSHSSRLWSKLQQHLVTGWWQDVEASTDGGLLYAVLACMMVLFLLAMVLGIRRWRRGVGDRREVSDTSNSSHRSTMAEMAAVSCPRRGGRGLAGDSPGGLRVGHPTEDGCDTHSDSGGSFQSCREDSVTDSDHARSFISLSGSQRLRSREETRRSRSSRASRKKKARRNKNLVHQYTWLEPLLGSIVRGEAASLGVVDTDNQECCIPLFVLAGTCPCNFPPAPMQAAVFCLRASGLSDFWWVKPTKTAELQLSRYSKSKLKNAPGSQSRNAYEFLFKRFVKGQPLTQGNITYGVNEANRAYIDEETNTGMRRRMVLYYIWVETFSRLSGSLEGKFCFERPAVIAGAQEGPHVPQLRTRQFSVKGDELQFGPYEEEEILPSMMPGEGFQEMY